MGFEKNQKFQFVHNFIKKLDENSMKGIEVYESLTGKHTDNQDHS